jgi:threonine synthase
MRLYIDTEEISDRELKSIVYASYSAFRHPSTVPLITLDRSNNLHLLELFHGPTFAFKDVALQFLGNLFEFFLVRKNAHLESGYARHHLTVIGATSGDTGSAAIYGLRGKKDVSIFITFPDGKVSPIQAAQMTTVLDVNVHNIAVQGTFDDCQDMVKALFGDAEMNKTHHLAAVNSINWARILAQITYYFYAYFQLLKQEPGMKKQVKFVVPTGNFGSWQDITRREWDFR